jgi:hypothetical protein
VFSYRLVKNYTDVFVEVDVSPPKQSFSSNVASVCELAALLVYVIALPLWIAVFALMLIVKLIIFIVKAVCNRKDEMWMPKTPRFPFLALSMTFLSIFGILACFSSLEIAIGTGLWIMLAVAVLTAFLRCVFRAALEEKPLSDLLLNACVCIVCILMCIFLTTQFLRVDIVNDLRISTPEFNDIYGAAYESDLVGQGVNEADRSALAAAAVGKANVANTIKMVAISAVGVIILLVSFAFFVRQLSNEGIRKENAKRDVSRTGLVLCAVILIVALVPSFIGTASADTCLKKYSNGDYKMLWEAHRYSGTTLYENYSTYTSMLQSTQNSLDTINEQLSSATEENRADLEASYRYAENYKELIDLKMERTLIDKKSVSGICIASGAALLVAQFFYTFIMHDDKKKKSEDVQIADETVGETDAELVEQADAVFENEDSQENEEEQE